MAREGGGSAAGRLALVLSVVALVLSWQAYRRTGGTIPGIDRPISVAWDEAAAEGAAAQARVRLVARRTEIAARQDVERIRGEIEEIRRRLQGSYEGAEGSVRERWQAADQALAGLEERLDQGGAQAEAALDHALDRLRDVGGEEIAEPAGTEGTEAPER